MKRKIYFIMLFIVLSISFIYAEEPSDWAVQEINEGNDAGLIHPDLLNHYTDSISRRDFCKEIMHIYIKTKKYKNVEEYLEKNAKGYRYLFKDLDKNSSEDKYIYAANILGIVNGVSKESFLPDASLTREQAAKILYNLYISLDGKDRKSTYVIFSDDHEIAHWAKPYVYKVKQLGIMNGVGNNAFNPQGTYTKQEAIVTALRTEKNIAGNLKEKMLQLINQKREELGLQKLSWLKEYEGYATIRAEELIQSFSIKRPDGTGLSDHVRNYEIVAESILKGNANLKQVFAKLIEEKNYYSYISNPTFDKIAIGIAYDKEHDVYYWQQIFYKGLKESGEAFVKNIPFFKKEVLRLTNIERVKAGLPELKKLEEHQNYVDVRTLELIEKTSHTRPDGSTFYSGIENYKYIGENLAAGTQIKTPEEVVKAWMNSPGHRANILNSKFTHLGVGITYDMDSKYKYYWEQLFYTPRETENDINEQTSFFKNEVLRLTNMEREKEGLSALSYLKEYDDYVGIRAKEIVKKFDHIRPDGSSCFSGVNGFLTVGENIAAGQMTPEEVVAGWMNSEGHRANILNASFTHLAVGFEYNKDSDYKYHWVQLFYTPYK